MPITNSIAISTSSGGSFSPRAFSGLRAWYDASQQTYSDAGTTPVTADGSSVYQWNDLSGNGFHLVQATGANRPTLKTGIIGGRPVLRGNGTSTTMVATGMGTGWSTTVGTVFAVFNPQSDGQYGLFNIGSNPSGYWRYGIDGKGYFGVLRSTRVEQQPATMPSTGNHIYSVVSGASAYDVYAEGSNVLSTTPLFGVATDFTAFFEGTGTGAGYGAVDLAEIIIYNTELSATNRQAVERYLSTKYGIALS